MYLTLFKVFPEFKFGWLIQELNINLPKELNFIQEALNSQVVRNNFQGYQNVVVPEVIWVFCSFLFGGQVTEIG